MGSQCGVPNWFLELVFLEYEQMIGIATDVAGLGNTITYLESDIYHTIPILCYACNMMKGS